jgi:outer membrane protein TolC
MPHPRLRPPRPRWLFLLLAGTLGIPAASAQPRLTLQQAIQSALENNPQLAAASAESDAAAARVEQARAAWLPRVDFSQSFTRGNNPVYVFGALLAQRQFTAAHFAPAGLNAPAPLDNFQTRFDGAWRLYDFGRTRAQVRGARQLRTAQDFKLEQERQDLILRVTRAYVQWTLSAQHLRAAELAVQAAEASDKRVSTLQQAGLVVSSDLLSAQVHAAQMRERAIRAAHSRELARLVLQRESGLVPEGEPPVKEPPGEPPAATLSMEELERTALAERPALRAAELEQQAARTGATAARAEFAPQLDLFASFERDAETLAGPSGTNWTAGARLHVNLFAGGAGRARLAEARAGARRAEQQLEWLRSGVLLEVRQSYLETTAAQQRAEVLRATAAQAAESLRILQNRYEAGLATITDLLRAQVAALDSRTGYLAAVHDWQLARVQLERAIGRLARHSAVLQSLEVP